MRVYTESDKNDIRNHIKMIEAMIVSNRLDSDLQHILSGLKQELLSNPRLAIVHYINALSSQNAPEKSWAHKFAQSRIYFMLPSLQKTTYDEDELSANYNNPPPTPIRATLNQYHLNILAEICKYSDFKHLTANRYISIAYLCDSLHLLQTDLQESLSELLEAGYISYDSEHHERIYITESGEDYLKENENRAQQNMGNTQPTLNVAFHQYRTKAKSLMAQFLPGLAVYPNVNGVTSASDNADDDIPKLTPLESNLLRIPETTRREHDGEIAGNTPSNQKLKRC